MPFDELHPGEGGGDPDKSHNAAAMFAANSDIMKLMRFTAREAGLCEDCMMYAMAAAITGYLSFVAVRNGSFDDQDEALDKTVEQLRKDAALYKGNPHDRGGE